MTKEEKRMINIGCPDCGADIELYDTSPDGKRGRYRCKEKKNCGRDTIWAIFKPLTFKEVLNNLK